jgi:hypothetical protein
MPGGPSREQLLAAAGSPRHGRVLLRGQEGRLCLAVVDTNGDGAFLATVSFSLDDDGVWRESGWGNASILEEGCLYGVGYAYGHTPDADSVEVGTRGDVRRVPVNEDGWWMVLVPGDGSDRLDLSRVPSRWPTSRAIGGGGPPRIAG